MSFPITLTLTSPLGLEVKYGLSLHLHPLFVYASNEGPCESAQMRRFATAFGAMDP